MRHLRAFTLVELVVAMAAASLLLSGLAVAVLISNRALEDAATPQNRRAVIQEVADRMVEDARHALTVQRSSQSVSMTLPDRDGDNVDETVVYAFGASGLTRSQSLHPSVSFLSSAPSVTTRVDGYTAPTVVAPATPIRLLGWTQSTTTSRSWSTSVEIPRDSRAGDLLVLVIASDVSFMGTWGGSWTSIEFQDRDDVYLSIFARTATSSEATSQTVFSYSFDANAITAHCLCFSGEGRTMFDDNVLKTHGYANPTTGNNVPQPLEVNSFPDHAMNLQVLAFENNPVNSMSSGLAGFSDVAVSTATVSGNGVVTLATAIRNGKLTSSETSKVALTAPTDWVQIATQWWP
jgi:prepilin-type N-terminal cleavage/methylation domain-containing protein